MSVSLKCFSPNIQNTNIYLRRGRAPTFVHCIEHWRAVHHPVRDGRSRLREHGSNAFKAEKWHVEVAGILLSCKNHRNEKKLGVQQLLYAATLPRTTSQRSVHHSASGMGYGRNLLLKKLSFCIVVDPLVTQVWNQPYRKSLHET